VEIREEFENIAGSWVQNVRGKECDPLHVFPLKVKCHFPADLPRLSLVIPSSGLDVSTFCGGAFS